MEPALGRVVAIQAASSPLRAEVEVSGAVTCARCASGRGCGAGLLGASRKNRRIAVRVGPGIHVKEGDEVRVELESRHLLRASWLVYGIPLAVALIVAAGAHMAGLRDPYTAVAALAGVGGGLAIARSRLRKPACLRQFTPIIVARVTPVH